jgi:hypothetical protein
VPYTGEDGRIGREEDGRGLRRRRRDDRRIDGIVETRED